MTPPPAGHHLAALLTLRAAWTRWRRYYGLGRLPARPPGVRVLRARAEQARLEDARAGRRTV